MNDSAALLADLRAAYEADIAARAELFPALEVNDRCRFCKRPWSSTTFRSTPTSDRHAVCAVSKEFVRKLCDVATRPEMSFGLLGKALGVSGQTVRRWWRSVP